MWYTVQQRTGSLSYPAGNQQCSDVVCWRDKEDCNNRWILYFDVIFKFSMYIPVDTVCHCCLPTMFTVYTVPEWLPLWTWVSVSGLVQQLVRTINVHTLRLISRGKQGSSLFSWHCPYIYMDQTAGSAVLSDMKSLFKGIWRLLWAGRSTVWENDNRSGSCWRVNTLKYIIIYLCFVTFSFVSVDSFFVVVV